MLRLYVYWIAKLDSAGEGLELYDVTTMTYLGGSLVMTKSAWPSFFRDLAWPLIEGDCEGEGDCDIHLLLALFFTGVNSRSCEASGKSSRSDIDPVDILPGLSREIE